MKKSIAVLLLCALGLSRLLQAQSTNNNVSKKGTTAAAFLSISEGARATGMGSAFVAVADDQSSIYWNPAGLASLEGVNVLVDHTEWIADLRYNFLSASVGLGSLGTIGASITASDIGDMKVTTVDQPNGTGEMFTVTDACFSLAYALKLTENFAIGFNPKLVYQSIWKTSASTIGFDVGVKYATPFNGITLGMSIANFGGKMQLTGNSAFVFYDADLTTTGNNGRIPAYLATDQWALPLLFRFGIAYRPELGDMNKLVIAVDALHPNDNYESVNVGGEYTFDDLISVRGGYKALFLQDSEESFTLGIGIMDHIVGDMLLRVDYAYQNFGRLNNIQKFSVAMSF